MRTGARAIADDWKTDAPGARRHIKSSDLPAPPPSVGDPEGSVASNVKVVEPPQGAHEDPALKGKRPDLEGHVRAPEVLFQAHSSALSVAFYDGDAFPAEYRGDAFVALHGSHSRPNRTGYKVIRVRMQDGKPTGEYQDFMTGFELDNDTVWARPAGVAVTKNGDLLVSDDANGTIFRVTAR